MRALNEWCVLLGGAGGHVRNVRALERDLRPPRRRGGPLPGDPRPQRHLRPARRRGRPPPQPRRPHRDRRHLAAGAAGPPGRCASSAPATAASPTAGRERRPTTAATCCTATPRSTSPSGGCAARSCTTRAPTSSPPAAARWSSGSTPTSPASSPPMADGANPVVAGASRHPQPALGRRWPRCRPRPRTIIAALTGAGARVLWLLENPRSGGSALGPENEAKRLAYNAWLQAQDGAHGGRFLTVDYLPAFTADGTRHRRRRARRPAARRPARHPGRRLRQGRRRPRRDRDLPAGRRRRRNTPAPPTACDAAANPAGNRLGPAGWTGEVRNAGDTDAAARASPAPSPPRPPAAAPGR